ncbi:MAG: nucleotidyltransferase domain-containing protein [Spirochaetae bacterium HGW-Spirochaetae-1]|jgi:predicted nucleotidyltransferase|nr:MAG: nucleotidyltransferase domain-containing protein [Spirochaetae bacterium HGW-Spirochaetae-1]
MEKSIIQYLFKRIPINTIYLYGSFGRGMERNDSDVDIAIIPGKEQDTKELFDISCDLAVIIDRDVDLVDFTAVDPFLRAEIIRSGRIIYCADHEVRLQHEMRALKDYSRIREERAMIIEARYGCYSE